MSALEKAIAFIKNYEALELEAYPDPKTKGKPYTNGYGATRKLDGSEWQLGDRITEAEADALLLRQLLTRYLPALKKIPHWDDLNENQQAALISFGYNVGSYFYNGHNFDTISRCLLNQDFSDIEAVFSLYCDKGTDVEDGLRKRRKAEAALFMRSSNSEQVVNSNSSSGEVQVILHTSFKRTEGSASALPNSHKRAVRPGERFAIASHLDDKNHWLINLTEGVTAQDGSGPYSQWRVFKEHCVIQSSSSSQVQVELPPNTAQTQVVFQENTNIDGSPDNRQIIQSTDVKDVELNPSKSQVQVEFRSSSSSVLITPSQLNTAQIQNDFRSRTGGIQGEYGTNTERVQSKYTPNTLTNQDIQEILISLGLLDPPADGKWGEQSKTSLQDFQKYVQLPPTGEVTAETKEALLKAKPFIKLDDSYPSRIVRFMQRRGYFVAAGNRRFNILMICGINPDSGELVPDNPNEFCDGRILLEIPFTGVPRIAGAWEATCEAGYYYVDYPMNPKGTARAEHNQFKAWQIGTHGQKNPHEALLQVRPITVWRYRGRQNYYNETNGVPDTGLFQINFHWGYNYPKHDIEYASAGCLVGRTTEGHRNCMRMIKRDRRFEVNDKYIFYITILSGKEIQK